MKMTLKRLIGLDNLSEEYKFGRSDSTGYTSAQKIPDKWVATTCGYCSVGCGMEIGVKEGLARARFASGESRQALPERAV
jgi:anaerobic selenocysteine-containing dehydrogenase